MQANLTDCWMFIPSAILLFMSILFWISLVQEDDDTKWWTVLFSIVLSSFCAYVTAVTKNTSTYIIGIVNCVYGYGSWIVILSVWCLYEKYKDAKLQPNVDQNFPDGVYIADAPNAPKVAVKYKLPKHAQPPFRGICIN